VTLDPQVFVRADELRGDDAEDRELLLGMAVDAREYLDGHTWCERVDELRFGDGVGGIVAAFLARIVPARAGVDDWLWVVVGDIPPMYLVTDEIETPNQALEAYIEWRREWVTAVREERPLDGLPPANAPPTRANADALASRLDYIENEIIAEWE